MISLASSPIDTGWEVSAVSPVETVSSRSNFAKSEIATNALPRCSACRTSIAHPSPFPCKMPTAMHSASKTALRIVASVFSVTPMP